MKIFEGGMRHKSMAVSLLLLAWLPSIMYGQAHTGITRDEAIAMDRYFNSPQFPTLPINDPIALQLFFAQQVDCGPITRDLDLNGDLNNESYHYHSLAECDGANYVSSIKNQVGGNCTRWACTAALEVASSIVLRDQRPETLWHSILDWSPINLSESYTTIQTPGGDIFTNLSINGTVHDYYFPFHTRASSQSGTDFSDHWYRIEDAGYDQDACNHSTYGANYENNTQPSHSLKEKIRKS
jgi:hypothetical protein